jgi:hypothetical protein
MTQNPEGPERETGQPGGSGSAFDRLDAWAGEIEDPGRWALMRDVVVFQGKLALDALRDLALSPISITAALIGFARDKDKPGRYFYPLMRTGRRSDTIINLFGASTHAGLEAEVPDDPSIDELVARVEKVIVREYEAGGITAHAKDAFDKVIDKAHEAARREADHLADNLGTHIREETERFKQ